MLGLNAIPWVYTHSVGAQLRSLRSTLTVLGLNCDPLGLHSIVREGTGDSGHTDDNSAIFAGETPGPKASLSSQGSTGTRVSSIDALLFVKHKLDALLFVKHKYRIVGAILFVNHKLEQAVNVLQNGANNRD